MNYETTKKKVVIKNDIGGNWIQFHREHLTMVIAELNECRTVMEIWHRYGTASGQSVNFDILGVFLSINLSKQLICSILGIPPLKDDAKYLGLPSLWGRSKAEALSFLIKNHLSIGEKSDVAQVIPTCAMACFLFPKMVVGRLSSVVSNFWWKGDPENKGWHGFSGFQSFQQSPFWLSKHGGSLWTQIHSGLELPRGSVFLTHLFSKLPRATKLHGHGLVFWQDETSLCKGWDGR